MSDFDAIDSLLDAVGPEAELPPCQVRRELRERARLSKAQVARALGVSPSTLSGWESGRDPAGEVRAKYAYLLDGLDAKLATETDTTAVPTAGAVRCVRHCCGGRHRHVFAGTRPGRGRGGAARRARVVRTVRPSRPATRGGVRSAPGPLRLPGNTRRNPEARAHRAICPGPRAAYSTPAPSGRRERRGPARAGVPGAVRAGRLDPRSGARRARRAPGRRRSRGHRVAEAGDPGRDAAAGRDPQGRPLRRDRPPLDPRHPQEADLQGRRPDLGGPPQVDAARTTARQARGHRTRHQRRLSERTQDPSAARPAGTLHGLRARPASRRCPPDHPARLGARRGAAQPDRPARRTRTPVGQ